MLLFFWDKDQFFVITKKNAMEKKLKILHGSTFKCAFTLLPANPQQPNNSELQTVDQEKLKPLFGSRFIIEQ